MQIHFIIEEIWYIYVEFVSIVSYDDSEFGVLMMEVGIICIFITWMIFTIIILFYMKPSLSGTIGVCDEYNDGT